MDALLRLSGVEAFGLAPTEMDKDAILRTHPFWQKQSIVESLPIEHFLPVLQHILSITQTCRHSVVYGDNTWDSDDMAYFKNLRGLAWAEPEQYFPLQQQALKFAKEQPQYQDELRRVVQKQIAENAGYMNILWFAQAEHGINHGLMVDTSDVLTQMRQASKVNRLDDILNTHPMFQVFLTDPIYEDAILGWIGRDRPKVHCLSWVAGNHQHLTSWVLAEHFQKPEQIQALAVQCEDGALLKAWYGVPLTYLDIEKEPLARILYAQKHDPSLLMPDDQLPSSWQVALSLCVTGLDFKKMLHMSSTLQQTTTLSLPDLGVELNPPSWS